MTPGGATFARAIIAKHSKSFALASRLLPARVRDQSVVIYAWCRRADDAVDLAGAGDAREAVGRLERELAWIFGSAPERARDLEACEADSREVLGAFSRVVHEVSMPDHYPRELIAGLAMDAADFRYARALDLFHYCYRVAGTVGLMICHVMGVARASALRNAVHLGMAMQLTNICRDVREDWDRGRLYLPDDLLARFGAADLRGDLGRPLPLSAKPALALAVGELLGQADVLYRSGDAGLPALSPRSAWAVRAARDVYSAIGDEIRAGGCDVFAPRAVVSTPRKLALVSGAAVRLAPIAIASARAVTSSFLPTLPFSPELVSEVRA